MKQKAFTLIEVLVSIAIVAILVAMFLPILAKMKEMSRQKQYGNTYQVEKPIERTFVIGDVVVVGGINLTGVVNDFGNANVDIITSSGLKLNSVNKYIIKKLPQ